MTTDLLETKTDTKSESLLDESAQVDAQSTHEQEREEGLQSPGERLQRFRERKGLTTEEVGEALKIPASYIDAIECSAFDKMPGLMFVRGYLRSYARLVGLDPDDIIHRFDQFTGDSGKETPRLSEGKDVEIRRQVSPVVSIGGAVSVISILLVVAFSYYYWGGGREAEVPAAAEISGTLAVPEPELTVDNLAPPVEEAASEQVGQEEQAVESVPLDEDLTAPAMSENAPGEALNNEAAQTTEQEVAGIAPVEPALPDETHLVIRFIEDCWIQVRDMAGKSLYTDVQKAGSTLDLEVPDTIQVRFGNVAGVQSVTFHGEPVEVKATEPGRNVVSLVLGSEDAG
ncbi:RodZ domain-containing protein [Endozoicomonas lisbonensis]|uniref:Cytoskeleton protein RodZ n=1 Tax=Endozoicomonas lisbonensis TaxID=3120522 RepID=A0ABV2SEE6_9GAMM